MNCILVLLGKVLINHQQQRPFAAAGLPGLTTFGFGSTGLATSRLTISPTSILAASSIPCNRKKMRTFDWKLSRSQLMRNASWWWFWSCGLPCASAPLRMFQRTKRSCTRWITLLPQQAKSRIGRRKRTCARQQSDADLRQRESRGPLQGRTCSAKESKDHIVHWARGSSS
jgi:hypothetical protein